MSVRGAVSLLVLLLAGRSRAHGYLAGVTIDGASWTGPNPWAQSAEEEKFMRRALVSLVRPPLTVQPSRTTALSRTSNRQSAPDAPRRRRADQSAASPATLAMAAPSRRVQYRSRSSLAAASPSTGTAASVGTGTESAADAPRRARLTTRTGSTRTKALSRRTLRRAAATARRSRPPRRFGPRSITPASTRPASGPRSSSRLPVSLWAVISAAHPRRLDVECRLAAQPQSRALPSS